MFSKPISLWILVLVCCLGLSACASGGLAIKDVEHNNHAIIVGHFDFSDSPFAITYVTVRAEGGLRRYLGIRGERVHVYDDGTFFAENIKPGPYRLSAVAAGKVVLPLPDDFCLPFDVDAGAVHYVGTYKYDAASASFIRTDNNPNEFVVLTIVRQLTSGTAWEGRLDQRIRELMGQG